MVPLKHTFFSGCTFTGVDSSCDLEEIALLSEMHPYVEWAFLYSPKDAGLPGRYPPISSLKLAFSQMPEHVKIALHICDSGVSDLLSGESVVSSLVEDVSKRRGRVQLNFNYQRNPFKIEALQSALERFDVEFITQHNICNGTVTDHIIGRPRHSILFDCGGDPVSDPASLPKPLSGISCGYAAGWGPKTLATGMAAIRDVAKGAFPWIDMSTHLRTFDSNGVDWLDLSRCRTCLEIFDEHARFFAGTRSLKIIRK